SSSSQLAEFEYVRAKILSEVHRWFDRRSDELNHSYPPGTWTFIFSRLHLSEINLSQNIAQI
ncbi:hypothetical protein ABTB92_19690, partial [Acinetobacter baumannii]